MVGNSPKARLPKSGGIPVILAPMLLFAGGAGHAQQAVSAPPVAPVVEQLPLTANAPSDEVLGERKRSGPVAPVEYAPRLVASEPRMAADDLPSYRLPYQLRPAYAPGYGAGVHPHPFAPRPAAQQIASSPATAPEAAAQEAAPASNAVSSPVAGRASVASSDDHPSGAVGAGAGGKEAKSPFTFVHRVQWIVLGLLVLVLVTLCAGLIAMVRRRMRPLPAASDQALPPHAGGPVPDAIPPRKGDEAGRSAATGVESAAPRFAPAMSVMPTAPVPSALVPGRLAYALAGLNSELDDASSAEAQVYPARKTEKEPGPR